MCFMYACDSIVCIYLYFSVPLVNLGRHNGDVFVPTPAAHTGDCHQGAGGEA